jgi:GH24 family phage-related lysozyme (muramidase)
MDVSSNYITWLANREAFSAKAYQDGSVNGATSYSIYFGHQIQSYEQNLRTHVGTRQEGETYLARDVKERINHVNAYVKKAINQGTFNACVDFCYNAGVGAFNVDILPTINAGGSASAIAEKIRTSRTTSTKNGVRSVNPELVKRRAMTATWCTGTPIGGIVGAISSGILVTLLLLVGCILYYFYIDNNEKLPFIGKLKLPKLLG